MLEPWHVLIACPLHGRTSQWLVGMSWSLPTAGCHGRGVAFLWGDEAAGQFTPGAAGDGVHPSQVSRLRCTSTSQNRRSSGTPSGGGGPRICSSSAGSQPVPLCSFSSVGPWELGGTGVLGTPAAVPASHCLSQRSPSSPLPGLGSRERSLSLPSSLPCKQDPVAP